MLGKRWIIRHDLVENPWILPTALCRHLTYLNKENLIVFLGVKSLLALNILKPNSLSKAWQVNLERKHR